MPVAAGSETFCRAEQREKAVLPTSATLAMETLVRALRPAKVLGRIASTSEAPSLTVKLFRLDSASLFALK